MENKNNSEEAGIRVQVTATTEMETDKTNCSNGEAIVPMECEQNEESNKPVKKLLANRTRRQGFKKKNTQTKKSINRKRPAADVLKKSLSLDMTEDDKKMLEFYRKRLLSLKHDNELLHKRTRYIVRENMRLLNMKPPLKITSGTLG